MVKIDLENLTIRHKIIGGFGILVILLITVGLITQFSLNENGDKLNELVNDVQPTVVESLELVDELDRASASLGFYLLSKEKVHKDDYLKYLDKVSKSVATLKSMDLIQKDSELNKLMTEVEANIMKLDSYKKKMLELATNDAKNIPAMAKGIEIKTERRMACRAVLEALSLSFSPIRRAIIAETAIANPIASE